MIPSLRSLRRIFPILVFFWVSSNWSEMTFHSSLSISPLVNTPWSFNESTSNLSHDFESSPCSFLYLVDYIVPYSYCKLTIIFSIPNSTCQSSILLLVRIYILRLKKVHSDFLRNTPYYIYYKTLIFSALSANNHFGELAGIGLDDQDASRQGSQIEMSLSTLEVG